VAGAGPSFFASPVELRRWFEANHESSGELLIGFHKKASGRPSVTYQEALDEALCFGWIDGVRKSLGADSYTIRFTPRRQGSIWSAVNVKRVGQLASEGRMQPAGLAAFDARNPEKTRQYSYENRNRGFDPAYESLLQANETAWRYFQQQPPWYQRTAAWWVMSAKREETRRRRLATLIEDCGAGRRIAASLPNRNVSA
jgi:uncharacterized protein YdeI (YjbR/CyaY-like superfamily)